MLQTAKPFHDYQSYLDNFHPNSDEYHQAVHEVFEDIQDFYSANEKYGRDNILERLMEPDRIIRFRVCWEDDDGNVQVNRAWRVQFNNALGAYKGGLRFHQTVNESVLKFLAFEQNFKNALTGLPMGGGKGGSDFNPAGRSDREVMRFCQAFMQELFHHLGPDVDVPAGDINVGTREIGYLFGHYLKLTNRWEGVLTGKAPNYGGSCGRTEATGYGVLFFTDEMLKAHGHELKGKNVVISGAGNVALHAAEKCLQEGAKVLSVSDSGGTLYFKDGLNEQNLEELKVHKLDEYRRLKTYEGGGEFQEGKKPWDIEDVDIALPCATENEMNGEEAKKLVSNKVIAIAEGANMPLNAEAQSIVMDAGVLYGPGKAANAGGVAVSGLERSQNATLESWSTAKVESKLKDIVQDIHGRCISHVQKEDGVYNYRKGANIYGFKKLADALLAYGLK